MEGALPPAGQEIYEEIQDLQAEAESVVAERAAVEERLEAAEAALEALDDVDPDETVYRRVGAVRVATAPEDAESAVAERADRLRERVDDLDATEERLRDRFESRKRDLKHLLGGTTGDDAPTDTGP